MDSLRTDLRHAVRGLLGSPLYTAIVLATLALGIGANTAIFSLVNGVLLRPLGYSDPDQLVVFRGTLEGEVLGNGSIQYPNFIDVRAQATVFDAAAAYDEWRTNLTGQGEPERLDGAVVNAEYFQVFGAVPAAGRFFLAEEDIDGNDQVVVLSHALWTRKFGRDPAAVGAELILDGRPHVVVGVAPADFEDPLLGGGAWESPAIWRPFGFFGLGEDDQPSRGSSSYTAVGRVRRDVAMEAAIDQVGAIARRLEEAYPETNTGRGMTLVPLREQMVGPVRAQLLLLLAAVALVLAIAAANVAGLMMARAADRVRETSVRLALGASRARLLKLFMAEGLVLSLGGGALGLVVGQALVRVFLSVGGADLPRAGAIGLDPMVLAFTTGISLLTGMICAIAPLRQAFRFDLQGALRGSGRTTDGRRATRARRAFVVAEVALAVVLLVGAALLLRSFVTLTNVEPGLDPDGLLAFGVTLPRAEYANSQQQHAFFSELIDRLESRPGVDSAGAINILPMSQNYDCTGLWAADGPEPTGNDGPCPQIRTVTPGYLDTMRMELRSGRWLTADDTADTARVAVINEAYAAELWSGEDPVGRSVVGGSGNPITIVGVVRGVKHLSLDEADESAIYLPHAQEIIPWHGYRLTVVMRVEGDPLQYVDGAREAIAAIDPQQPLADVRTVRSVVDATLSAPRFRALLVGAFAAVALVLASLGVYGVVSYSVMRRRRDVAIRVALGADAGRVLRQVLSHGMRPVVLGTAMGVLGAVIASRALESWLYGITPLDPVAFAAVPAILLAVALAACWIPARRATRVDPMGTLRDD